MNIWPKLPTVHVNIRHRLINNSFSIKKSVFLLNKLYKMNPKPSNLIHLEPWMKISVYIIISIMWTRVSNLVKLSPAPNHVIPASFSLSLHVPEPSIWLNVASLVDHWINAGENVNIVTAEREKDHETGGKRMRSSFQNNRGERDEVETEQTDGKLEEIQRNKGNCGREYKEWREHEGGRENQRERQEELV